MSPAFVFILGVVLLVIFFLIRMPIAFSMGLAGFLGLSYLTSFSTALMFVPRDLFEVFSSYSISAIPMFVLMGYYGFSAAASPPQGLSASSSLQAWYFSFTAS